MTPPSPEPADLVVTGCTVLVHDDRERGGFGQDRAVVVRDGIVDSVTTAAAAAAVPAADRIDARGRVALPGLIDCHTHAPMVALRGLAEDLPTEEWFNDVVWPVESNLTAGDVVLAARPACAEMIRAGVTTFADSYFHMDRVAEVVDRCGDGRTSPRRDPKAGRRHWSSRCGAAAGPAAGSPPPSPRTPPTR